VLSGIVLRKEKKAGSDASCCELAAGKRPCIWEHAN
jgi:hypothetical protein